MLRALLLRGARAAALLTLLATASTACGLPRLPFLGPPIRDSDSGNVVVFRHNADDNNVDEFRGYELYYRFYPNTGEGEEQWIADNDAILDSPRSPNPSRLVNRGYRRIRPPQIQAAPPLLRVGPGLPLGTRFPIRLFFPHDPEEEPIDDEDEEPDGAAFYEGKVVRLRRGPGVNEEDGETPKRFFPVETDPTANGVYAEGDADLVNLFDLLEDEGLFVAVYGLAYGITGDFQRFYSVPEFLGRDIELGLGLD